MKTLFTSILLVITFYISAQVPQQISYQAVARNSSGQVIQNQTIGVKLDLRQGSSSGTIVFSETHSKTTNQLGLFTLGIGSVSTAAFSSINWENGPYFLEVSIDPNGGSSYTSMGTQQLLSVPYALYAKNAGGVNLNAGNGISINSGTITNTAPNQTVNISGSGVTGSYPNYTISAASTSSTNISAGNANLIITQSGTDYTLTPITPILDVIGGSISGAYPNQTLTVPAGVTYTNGSGISITSGSVITNTAPDQPVTLIGNGGTTVSGSYPNYTVTSASSQSTTLIQGNNISLNQSGNSYTVSAPAYSISLPGGNVAQITNGISTSTAPISPTNLTLSGANNNILSAGGNTIALNTYSAGTGIAISGSAPNFLISNTAPAVTPTITGTGVATVNNIAPNYTVNVPMSIYNNITGVFTTGTQTILVTPTLSIVGNVLRSGPSTNTVNIPAPLLSYTPTSSEGTIFLGSQSAVVPNYTLANTSNTITLNNGFASSTAVIPVPVLALTGTTLQSGPLSNTVSLAGLNGIYGGSGAIPVGETTVSVGTNTLTFLSGNTSGKSIANFYGGGFTGTNLTIGHIGSNSAALRIVGSASSTPVLYGNVTGSSNGISITGGSSSNGLYATTNNEAGVGTFTTGTGKFVISHNASMSNPTMHLRENTSNLNRIKFSNTTIPSKFFELASQTNTLDKDAAISFNHHDGTTYRPILLVYGDNKVVVHNMNTALASLHVMDTAKTGNGIASEGFAQPGAIIIARNNQAGFGSRQAILATDEIGKLSFSGHNGTSYGNGPKISARAIEAYTGSGNGSELVFSTIPAGSTTSQDVMTLQSSGNVLITNSLVLPTGASAGRVLTSDASGIASWQNPSNTSPWIQGVGTVTLANVTDKVGIGINNPNASLHINNNAASLDGLSLDLNNTSNGSNGLQLRHFGLGNAAYIEINNQSSSARIIEAQSNGTGQAIRAVLTNSLNSSVLLDVEHKGTGKTAFFRTTNTFNSSRVVDILSMGSGAALGAENSGTGSAAILNVNNPASTAFALQVGNSGSGSAIYASNSSATGRGIEAFANSGHAIYAANSSSTSATLYAENTGTANVAFFNASNGRALYARNTSTLNSSVVEVESNGNGVGIQVYKNAGSSGSVASFANFSTTNPNDAVVISNNGSANSLYVAKPVSSTSGNVAKFENAGSNNPADAVMIINNGVGAAIKATSSSTVAGSTNASVWLENGHLKSTQTTAAVVSTVSISGGYSGVTLTPSNCTDVKGSLSAVCTTTGNVNVGGQVTIRVTFNKAYTVNPTVVITPNNDLGSMSYFISTINTSSFNITIKNNTGNNISGSSFTYGFNYMVIE